MTRACVCVCVCVCVCSVAQLCPTLVTTWTVALPDSSVHGISQARMVEWVAISSCRGSSRPRDRTFVSCIFCIGRRFPYHWAAWEAPWEWGQCRYQVHFLSDSTFAYAGSSAQNINPSPHTHTARWHCIDPFFKPSTIIFTKPENKTKALLNSGKLCSCEQGTWPLCSYTERPQRLTVAKKISCI